MDSVLNLLSNLSRSTDRTTLQQRNPSIRYPNPIWIDMYLIVVLVIGIIGNIAGLLRHMYLVCHAKNTSCSEYICGICIADLTSLVPLLVASYLKQANLRMKNNVMCKVVMFLTHAGPLLCAWVILAFTFERLIIVRYPFKRQAMTVARARKILLILLICTCIVDGWFLIGYRVEHHFFEMELCLVKSEYLDFAHVFKRIYMFLVFLFPATAISVFNICIVFVLVRLNVRRNLLCRQETYQRRTSVVILGVTHRFFTECQRRRNARTKTLGLIVASIAFLCLNCPHYVWTLLRSRFATDFEYHLKLDEIFQTLLVTQYALHCFMYGNLGLRMSFGQFNFSALLQKSTSSGRKFSVFSRGRTVNV